MDKFIETVGNNDKNFAISKVYQNEEKDLHIEMILPD